MHIAYNALTIKKPLTGIPNFVYNELKHLLQNDNENKYLIFAWGDFEHDEFNLKNSRLIKFRFKNTFFRIFLEQIIIPFYLLKYRADCYFSTSFVIPFILFFFKKIKKINTVYDLSYIKTPETVSKLTYLYYKLTKPFSIRIADIIPTISESTKRDIIKFFNVNEEKIVVAYPGITMEEQGLKEVHEKYSLPQKYILTLGRLEKRKNILNLLKAYKKYSDDVKNPIPLVLAGFRAYGSNEFDSYIENEDLSKHIIKPGYIDEEDLFSVYSNASFFIYPSLYEGFGLPIVESFIAGTPVITSNTSSMPEAGGDAALYINPTSIDELKEKIMLLAETPSIKDELIEKGKKQAKCFTWEIHSEIVLKSLK